MERSDDDLLQSTPHEPEAFALFYRRHAAPLAAYFLRRTRNPEVAADLTAETFAAALDGCRRFDPAKGPAVGWLYGIARRLLAHATLRGHVEDRARRKLGMEPLLLTDEALERVEALATADATARALHDLMDELPADQREAVHARVLEERDYAEIAVAASLSEATVRQRVSRGLARLRAGMKEEIS